MQEYNALPVAPKAQLEAGNFAYTHCEDASGNVVDCASVNSVIEIVVAPSYSNVPKSLPRHTMLCCEAHSNGSVSARGGSAFY